MNLKSGANSRLGRALAISLALHGFVLSTAVSRPQLQQLPQALIVSLTSAFGGAPSLIPVSQPQASQPPAARETARALPRQPELVTREASVRATETAVAPRPEGAAAASGDAVAPLASAPQASTKGEPAQKDNTSASGPDADGVRQYRLSLASAARHFKRYPPRALEYGWTGRAEIALAIGASGAAQAPQLLRPSGHEELDRAALEMIARAAAVTELPSVLHGHAFAVKLPVLFDLEEE